jgi:hypothetical protein
LAFPEELIGWLKNNPQKLNRYGALLQALMGLFLLWFGYFSGRAHFHLIREGVRTQGIVVGHATEYFRNSSRNSSTTAYMPIVEFRTGDRVIHFKNWLGSSSTGDLHTSVVVLYDPVDPTTAMIDRPVMNWIPWAPCFVVGSFLVLVAIKGSLSSLNA